MLNLQNNSLESGRARSKIASPIQPLRSSVSTLATRRTKKSGYAAPPDFTERANRLGPDEQRILKDYAGDRIETRTRALEQMEFYRQHHNNQPPIVSQDSQKPNARLNDLEWTCLLCSAVFSTFQKVAIHLTSKEWALASWPCPLKSCSHAGPYKALDQLRRHIRIKHANAHIGGVILRSTSLGSARPPSPTPSLQGQTVEAIVESQYESSPSIESTQVAASGPNFVGHGVEHNNQQHHLVDTLLGDIIPQPRALPMFDQPHPILPTPTLNQSIGNSALMSYHTGLYYARGSMTNIPLHATDVGEESYLNGGPQHVRTNASGSLVTQYPPQRKMNQGDVSDLSFEGPAFNQLWRSASSGSNHIDRVMSYSEPPRYARGSAMEILMPRHTPSGFPSSERQGEHEFICLGDGVASDTFWISN